jgi:hypothetical protein
MADKILIEKASTRSSFGIDHNLKYLDFEGTVPNKLAMLREIAESLPEGKRKAVMKEIIEYFHAAFTEVLKDWHGLQEGSKLRNVVDDCVGSLIFKEKEIEILTEIITKMNNDKRRGSTD